MPRCLTGKDLVFVNLWKALITSTVERQVRNIGRLQFNTYRYPLVCVCWEPETQVGAAHRDHWLIAGLVPVLEKSIKHGAAAT